MKVSKTPPYVHRSGGRGALYVQIKVNDGRFVSHALRTSDPSVARARVVPFIKRLIGEGRLDSASRAARIYVEKRQCPACGQYLK